MSGRSYDSAGPFSGAPWATAADGGGEADVNLAVAAARRALAGPWGWKALMIASAAAAGAWTV